MMTGKILTYLQSSDFEFIFKLLFSSLLAGLLGLERERKGQAAGLRTHMVLCIGSMLAMHLSIALTQKFTNITVDRIPGQVITGIGFLGAGAIIRFGITIRGLTTAAGLWTAAIIGLTVGGGYYGTAAAAAIAVFIVTSILDLVEKKLKHTKHTALITIILSGEYEKIGIKRLTELFNEFEVAVYEIEKTSQQKEKIKLSFRISRFKPFDFDNLIKKLENIKGIENITVIPETL